MRLGPHGRGELQPTTPLRTSSCRNRPCGRDACAFPTFPRARLIPLWLWRDPTCKRLTYSQ